MSSNDDTLDFQSSDTLNPYRIFQPPDLLKETIANATASKSEKFKQRDFVAPLLEYCLDNRFKGKIGIVYGLRSTGKTVGMLQAAEALIEQGRSATYAAFKYKDDTVGMHFATEEMKALAEIGVTHFFLDEATHLDEFLTFAASWPDTQEELRIKIVISSDDNFLLWTAQRYSLCDRYVEFDANWMSYPEFVRLTGKPYAAFKREGGIFSGMEMEAFIQSAAVDNLQHTIDHLMDDANIMNAYTDSLYGISVDSVHKAITIILKHVVEGPIKERFLEKARPKDMASPDADESRPSDKDYIIDKVVNSMTFYRNSRFNPDPDKHPDMATDVLLAFLVMIGCLFEVNVGKSDTEELSTAYAFNHNALMRFAVEKSVLGLLERFGVSHQDFAAGIKESSKDVSAGSIVLAHAFHGAKPGDNCFKYRDSAGRELEVAVINRDAKSLKLIDTTSETRINPSDAFANGARDLFSPAILKNIGIDESFAVTRVLAYMGKTKILSSNGKRLLLVNIEQLLTHYRDLDEFFGQLDAHADAAPSKENLGGDGVVEVEYV
jgi:hypothetical protein